MITHEQSIGLILERVPSFRQDWDKHLAYWDDEKPGACIDMSAFSDYIEKVIISKQIDQLTIIFDLIEYLMRNGDDEVRTAVTTCCIENLINVSDTGKFAMKDFAPFLGPESRAYFDTWNEFTGVRYDDP